MLCPLNIKNGFYFLTAWSENDKSMSMRKPVNKFSPLREARFSCKATYLSVSLRSKKDSKSEFAASLHFRGITCNTAIELVL